jgi:hypothetical protein
MTRPLGRGGRRGRLDVGGRQVSHQEKKKRVRGDVQVEIDEAMHEEAGASQQAGELQGPWKRMMGLAQFFEGFEEQDAEKPGTTEAAEKSGFGKGLEVIVVGVVDDLAVVE